MRGVSRLLADTRRRRSARIEMLPRDTLGDPWAEVPLLARTADRIALGCMNDVAFRCRHAVANAGARSGELESLNYRLRRNVSGALGYERPVDLVVARSAK